MKKLSLINYKSVLGIILGPEKNYYFLLFVYGAVVTVLSLILPLSIQALINSIANVGVLQRLITVSVVLLVILTLSAVSYGIQEYVAEVFRRRFFARIVALMTTRVVYAKYAALQGINRTTLMQKFFEIISIDKSLPYVLIGGYSLALQILAGVILTSFYHPVFLLFNCIVLLILYAIWKGHSKQAIAYAIDESDQKYQTADWLLDMGRNHLLFKSKQMKNYATKRSNTLTGYYIDARKNHFKHLFSQICYLLGLYVLGNSILLFISGYFVLNGQLSLGQLVATEIIFSSIFASLAKSGSYLGSFYDLQASCEKLISFYRFDIEQDMTGRMILVPETIAYKGAKFALFNEEIEINHTFKKGSRTLIATVQREYKNLLIGSLMGFHAPEKGVISVNNELLDDIDIHYYRQGISIIDESEILNLSIKEYLSYGLEDPDTIKITEILTRVGIIDTITQLEDGVDTVLDSNGSPLTHRELVLLKLGRAILNKSKYIMMNHHISFAALHNKALFAHLDSNPDITLIYFSNTYHDAYLFDHYMACDQAGLKLLEDRKSYDAYIQS